MGITLYNKVPDQMKLKENNKLKIHIGISLYNKVPDQTKLKENNNLNRSLNPLC
jgi:hypothetical protein